MKFIPQYKVISPYNYDRDKIEVTVKWRDAFSLKIKLCVIGYCKRFQTL